LFRRAGTWLRTRRNARLHLNETPARLGGRLTGTILLPARRPFLDTELASELSCVEIEKVKDAPDRERVRWSARYLIPAGAMRDDGGLLEVAVNHELPADRPTTTFRDETPEIRWRLRLTDAADRAECRIDFQVPVATPQK
jgi:hypothetical protein